MRPSMCAQLRGQVGILVRTAFHPYIMGLLALPRTTNVRAGHAALPLLQRRLPALHARRHPSSS
jgi:hypothetical protein